MIQLNKPKIYQESIDNVSNVLRSGWTGLGAVVTEFEEAVKAYLDTPYAIATNSGTAALQLALTFLNKAQYGSYVITTPNTFISTNHSILHAGLLPVFADIELDTGNIDCKSIQKLLDDPFIKRRTRGIIAVHYGGQPVDMDQLYDIANNYNIDVIEDAAHAFGASYKNDKIGCKYSRLVAFSFHAVKPLSIGDGGLLTTNDSLVDTEARKLRWCGINKSTAERTGADGYKWDYDVEYAGFKSHMNNIQAAIGMGQLIYIDKDAKERQEMVDLYRSLLKDIPQITLLRAHEDRVSSNHLFVIRCENKDTKYKLMAYLSEHGIQTGCHYRPSHLYRLYSKYESDNGCPNAVRFFEEAISLPLHLELTKEDVMYVCEKTEDFFKGKGSKIY